MNEETLNRFRQAEKMFSEKEYDRAKKIYASLTGEAAEPAAFSWMRLGEIANQGGKAVYARRLYLKAFRTYPALAFLITPKDHPMHDYVYYEPVREKRVAGCPLCGLNGAPYWSYIMVTNLDFQKNFHPVRTWKYCKHCHHLYASAYPSHPAGRPRQGGGVDNEYIKVIPGLFRVYSDILNQIKGVCKGTRLLEVGVGGGELIAVAQEMGFDAKGIDISYNTIVRARDIFDVDVACADFFDYETDETFDVVCMGDVVEHMAYPKAAVQKAADLLCAGGILWVSTPNFQSAAALYYGHGDPMRRVAEHLSYFSRQSLMTILCDAGLKPLSYRISKHYAGSMEVMAQKR